MEGSTGNGSNTFSSAALLTAVSQHERAWTGAFYPIVARRLINQCLPGSLSPCIPLDGDMSKIKRVEMQIETAVGKQCKQRALEEANRRFDVELTDRQMVAAIVDPRTKGLKHLSSAEEKRAAKAAFKRAYIQWGKQAHGFSDTLHQAHGRAHENQVRIKRESVEGSGAAGVQPSKKQKVSVAINEGGLVGGGGGAMNEADLDWDDKGTVVVMALEEQLEVEFSPVWHTHMDEGGQREYRGAIFFHKRRRVCSSRATKLTSVM